MELLIRLFLSVGNLLISSRDTIIAHKQQTGFLSAGLWLELIIINQGLGLTFFFNVIPWHMTNKMNPF